MKTFQGFRARWIPLLALGALGTAEALNAPHLGIAPAFALVAPRRAGLSLEGADSTLRAEPREDVTPPRLVVVYRAGGRVRGMLSIGERDRDRGASRLPLLVRDGHRVYFSMHLAGFDIRGAWLPER